MDYEKKDFRKLYEDLVKSDWFKRAYHNKSLGEYPFDIPQLAESEDERIRKELIEAFEVYDIESSWNLIPVKRILAWLEKRNIEKIRQEIERMHQQAVLAACGNDTDWLRSRIATCVDILAFIDSLPEEKPDKTDELPRFYGD